MAEEYEVRWSVESLYDVADIEDYIEYEFDYDRAQKFHDDIDQKGQELRTQYRLSSGTGIHYRGFIIMKTLIRPSILFFIVDDSKKTVFVLRVLRHERNWQKMLRETTFYTFRD